MISMEIAMNLVDYILVGDAKLTLWVIPFMLTAGFLTPWPYNYWRLKNLMKLVIKIYKAFKSLDSEARMP